MTNDTHADAVCIVPAHNAMSVATYSNSKDIINLLGGDNNAANYLRDFGISYNVTGLLKFDNDYRSTHTGPVTVSDGGDKEIDYIIRDGKKVALFAEWGVALKLVKPSNANTKKMDVFDYGTGAVLDINLSIKPYTNNAFNWVSPIGGDANAHLHPLPSDNYEFYLKKYLPARKTNKAGPSYPDDYDYSRNTPYFNVVIDPINIYFYRKSTTISTQDGKMTTLPQTMVTVPLNLIK